MVASVADVYLSGPIIHTNLRKDDFYRLIIDSLESRNLSVFAPQFLAPLEPAEIYQRDISNIRACDILIGEVSNPSLGVGMEIMLAIELRKPVLLFRSKSAEKLSRMVSGSAGKALFEYEDLDEVREFIGSLNLKSLVIRSCPNCASHIAEKTDGLLRCVLCGHHEG
jgi:nucleoside 2-deoxyribosyltransferase